MSQKDLSEGFAILVLNNPQIIYPNNKLKFLKCCSGQRIPRLNQNVLSKLNDVLTGRQLARNANCKAKQKLIKASLHFVEMLLSMTAKDNLRHQWGDTPGQTSHSPRAPQKEEKSPRFFRGDSPQEWKPCSWATQNHF